MTCGIFIIKIILFWCTKLYAGALEQKCNFCPLFFLLPLFSPCFPVLPLFRCFLIPARPSKRPIDPQTDVGRPFEQLELGGPKVIYPKYYKHSNESCDLAIFWTDWNVRARLIYARKTFFKCFYKDKIL